MNDEAHDEMAAEGVTRSLPQGDGMNRCHFCDAEMFPEHEIRTPYQDGEALACSNCVYNEPQIYFWRNVEQNAEIARLKAEIERLRKAGKAVVDECDYLDHAFFQVPVREINALSSEVEG